MPPFLPEAGERFISFLTPGRPGLPSGYPDKTGLGSGELGCCITKPMFGMCPKKLGIDTPPHLEVILAAVL